MLLNPSPPVLARVNAVVLAATDAIGRALRAEGQIEVLRAALAALAEAEEAVRDARTATDTANTKAGR